MFTQGLLLGVSFLSLLLPSNAFPHSESPSTVSKAKPVTSPKKPITSRPKSKLGIGAIIAIIVILVIVIAICFVAFICFKRMKAKKAKNAVSQAVPSSRPEDQVNLLSQQQQQQEGFPMASHQEYQPSGPPPMHQAIPPPSQFQPPGPPPNLHQPAGPPPMHPAPPPAGGAAMSYYGNGGY